MVCFGQDPECAGDLERLPFVRRNVRSGLMREPKFSGRLAPDERLLDGLMMLDDVVRALAVVGGQPFGTADLPSEGQQDSSQEMMAPRRGPPEGRVPARVGQTRGSAACHHPAQGSRREMSADRATTRRLGSRRVCSRRSRQAMVERVMERNASPASLRHWAREARRRSMSADWDDGREAVRHDLKEARADLSGSAADGVAVGVVPKASASWRASRVSTIFSAVHRGWSWRQSGFKIQPGRSSGRRGGRAYSSRGSRARSRGYGLIDLLKGRRAIRWGRDGTRPLFGYDSEWGVNSLLAGPILTASRRRERSRFRSGPDCESAPSTSVWPGNRFRNWLSFPGL